MYDFQLKWHDPYSGRMKFAIGERDDLQDFAQDTLTTDNVGWTLRDKAGRIVADFSSIGVTGSADLRGDF